MRRDGLRRELGLPDVEAAAEVVETHSVVLDQDQLRALLSHLGYDVRESDVIEGGLILSELRLHWERRRRP